jgi:hypothetical protein
MEMSEYIDLSLRVREIEVNGRLFLFVEGLFMVPEINRLEKTLGTITPSILA